MVGESEGHGGKKMKSDGGVSTAFASRLGRPSEGLKVTASQGQG